MTIRYLFASFVALLAVAVQVGCTPASADVSGGTNGAAPAKKNVTLLNVSYDPTREFYQEFNESFAAYWKEKSGGQVVTVEQSHGGSGKQARAVIDGLEADVVTLALSSDIDAISERAKLLPANWQEQREYHSAPYTSTIVFLVRKGNPKGIKDWGDLVKGDVEIITPNPKTSGGAKYNYLAAWGYALKQELGDINKVKTASPAELKAANDKARAFVSEIYKRVPVLDSGARAATNTFVKSELGDVLLTWENEAYLAVKELGPDKVEIVVPGLSIRAEPPVAVVEEIAKKHGTLEVAKAYLDHLYSPQGQQLAAKHFYRPAVPGAISEEQQKQFAQLELFSLDEVFGGWKKAQPEHFDDKGIFDQIYNPAGAK